jgi:peptide/nickel transport system permease protein/oligopeptide transport system permease protein
MLLHRFMQNSSWPPDAQPAVARFFSNRVAQRAAGALALVAMIALVWPMLRQPWLASWLPQAIQWSPTALSDDQFQAPSWQHWWGTDLHGRDLLSRTWYGTRISLLVGLTGAGISLLIGVLWGATAGYLGQRWDIALMRVVDMLYALPAIVLVLVLITVVEEPMRKLTGGGGAGLRLGLMTTGLGAVSWLTMARIVRGQVLSVRARPFVEASRALGCGPIRLLFRHILPQVYGVILVYLTLTVPAIVLSESFLSYLGLGIQPPQASLGLLIADAASGLNPIRSCWWLLVFPGGVLALTLVTLTLVGDGLRDALEVRTSS